MSDLFSIDSGTAPAVPFCVIELPGAPRGKGRPRGRIVRPRRGGSFIQFYTDAKTGAYERALGFKGLQAMRGKQLLTGPVGVRMFAMMPVPRSWSQRERDAALAGTIEHTSKPDADNLAKVLDALNGTVWADDSQIIRALVVKEYAENPGLIIEVYRLP